MTDKHLDRALEACRKNGLPASAAPALANLSREVEREARELVDENLAANIEFKKTKIAAIVKAADALREYAKACLEIALEHVEEDPVPASAALAALAAYDAATNGLERS